jgi:hypothetical protein
LLVGLIVVDADAPFCVSEWLWPPIVIVPLRDEVEVLASTVTVTEPFPLPLAGLTLAHERLSDTDQLVFDVTLTV